MSIWRCTECGSHVDTPTIPDSCPGENPPACPDPTSGFTTMCEEEKIYKCRSCRWVFYSSSIPLRCPDKSGISCTGNGNFLMVC